MKVTDIYRAFHSMAAGYTRSVQKVSSHAMWKIDIYWGRHKIQETLYKGQWHLNPLQSRHLGTSHSSPSRHQLLRGVSLNLIDSLKCLPFQRWFQFGEKPEVTGHQIWAVGGLNHRGDLMFGQKTLHETWCMSRCMVMMKLPITSCPKPWPSKSSEYFSWRNVQA